MVKQEIGCVFTPEIWAEFAIEKYGLFDKWMQGASILDPTMGNGNLLAAIICFGLKKGYQVGEMPVENLFGVEMNKRHYCAACERLEKLCGSRFQNQNFINGDILFTWKRKKIDIVFGNPPWVSFSSLPLEYGKKIKSVYVKSGLASHGSGLLLGNSQINLAALVFFHVLKNMMKENGEAVVFMPLSVLFHAGAHREFTSGKAGNISFSIDEVTDLEHTDAFQGICTRFGIIKISRNKTQSFPVPYFTYNLSNGKWTEKFMSPLLLDHGPMCIQNSHNKNFGFKKIPVDIKSKPRQGINTCGANHLYFFDSFKDLNGEICEVSNKTLSCHIEKQFVYPLIQKENFRNNDNLIHKWVILPYNENGKILTEKQIKNHPHMHSYFKSNKDVLGARKGTLIRHQIENGLFWALLGVGPYCFYPYKIVWEACGKKDFYPRIFEGMWQANQALQVYMPFTDRILCKEIINKMNEAGISEMLSTMNLGGSMCFAQPGVMKTFFDFASLE